MMRNNLWIHAGGAQNLWNVRVPDKDPEREAMRKGVLFDILKADWRTDIDYDGFDFSALDVPKNGTPQTPFMWRGVRLTNLSALADAVGIERHGRVVDREKIFEHYLPPPYDPAARPTFLLRPDGNAVDAGVSLPNIAEEYHGNGPDLGAFEVGAPTPHVGPREGNDCARLTASGCWIIKSQRTEAHPRRSAPALSRPPRPDRGRAGRAHNQLPGRADVPGGAGVPALANTRTPSSTLARRRLSRSSR